MCRRRRIGIVRRALTRQNRAARVGASMRPVLAVAMLLAGPAAASAQISETLSIPTGDGDRIHVEIQRPATLAPVPVILTYSPYNVLGEGTLPNLANDGIGQHYVPRGYARAVADVLGTRNSSGCWDYGGPQETQSGVDVVNALAQLPWANGKVAMIGGSYDGTTANMVASAGAEGLAAIVPEAAISRWYGYAYSDGVRYLGNSQHPTDEGFDTPLAFDFGFGRTPPTQVTPQLVDALADRTNPCDSAEHTARGYDTSPDYDDFWAQRDYRRDYDVPALIVHGWQDYNVRQSEGIDLFAQQDGAAWLYMFQGAHESPGSRLPAAARHVLRAHAQGRADVSTTGHHRGHRRRLPRARVLAAAGDDDADDRAAGRPNGPRPAPAPRRPASRSTSRAAGTATCGSRARRSCAPRSASTPTTAI